MHGYKAKIGKIISKTRESRGLTQAELAAKIGTSQSAVGQIEKGQRNISIEMLGKISHALQQDILQLNTTGKVNFKVHGPTKLSGTVAVNTSKNAAVSLLCAALLNQGKTTFRNLAKIEEVFRLIEVLQSIGVSVRWLGESNDLEVNPPKVLKLDQMDVHAAKRTRSIIMFLGPLHRHYGEFKLPFVGGCNLGKRTIEPHLLGLAPFGVTIDQLCHEDYYQVHSTAQTPGQEIVLTERGNTVTENILMAAATCPQTVTLKNASNDYMIIDLCHYLIKLGVKIEGVGTTTLQITGQPKFNKTIEFTPSEDPIEAMSLLTAGIITDSELTVARVPIDYLDIELAILRSMQLKYRQSPPYQSANGFTKLVDLTLQPSELTAPKDKLASFPGGVNMDNLPFLGLLATTARGRSMVHDWSYENRAIYMTDLTKLGANIELADPHRVYITGPTHWHAADMVAPPALRPSVVILLAMLAAPGTSVLRDVYNIKRGYEDFAERLNALGAQIETTLG